MKKFISFLIVILLVYFMYTVFFNTSKQSLANNFTKNELKGNFLERTLSNILVNILNTEQGKKSFQKFSELMEDNIKKIIPKDFTIDQSFSDLVSLEYLKSDQRGKGECIICGQNFHVKYQIMNDNYDILYEQEEKSSLGASTNTREINMLVPGMKIGETINSIFKFQFGEFDDKKFNVNQFYKIFIQLLKKDPPYLMSTEDIFIFDSQVSNVDLDKILCGDKISFQFRIIDLSTKKVIFDSQKTFVTSFLGDTSLPIVFNYALHKKPLKSLRSVICEGKHLKSINSNVEEILLNLEKLGIYHQTLYMVEFYNTSVLEKD
ncbi:MAG: hypothetical protein ISN64_01755 [Rickettsia sp.]|nr:hypothetical protein [Rickettsia sp.]